MGILSDDLVSNIKRRAFVPQSQTTYQDSDFLALAYDELLSYIVPMIMDKREDFFLYYQDDALTADVASYLINDRALGNAAKSFWHIDQNGNPEYRIERTDVDRLDEYFLAVYSSTI